MTEGRQYKELAADLQVELNTIKAFNEILQKEQCALIKGDIEDLDFLASEKQRLIEQLTKISAQRKHFLTYRGLKADTEGMKKLLSTEGSYFELNKKWNELLELVAITNQLNKTNGTIISTRLQHTQRSLTALQCAAGNISLYGPQGLAFGINNISNK